MPRFSIVIPSYLRSDKLRDCLASIVEWTDMDQTEVIVVANGASEETRQVCAAYPVQLLWHDEPLGYPRAVNHGIRAAQGEFIVLLNDDAELLSQPRNQWLDILVQPMLQDGAVGVTGPLMAHDENSNHQFLIFFCVMVRKQCFDEVGLLDEGFAYFGEDTAFCIEAEKKGWKVVRVPEEHPTELVPLDPSTTTLETWKHDKVHTGHFRIWHDAESTIGRLPNCDEVLRESRARLRELYGNPDDINIHRAMVTDGWIAHDELAWLARTAKSCGPNATIVQVGVWHGKSSRAISDNMGEGSKLFDCDTFSGSSGEPEQHASAKEREGDGCFQWYWDNQYEQILKGEVIPMRLHSANAAHTLAHRGIKADMIFIDADHTYEGVKADIEAWLPLLKPGGIICGHDYYKEGEDPFAWMGVRQAVQEAFPQVQKSATSIWHVRPHEQVGERGHVYDTFIFSRELDLLELRLNVLDEVVDRWVLVEATSYHNGEPKPLVFEDNKERFAKWLPKIAHVVIDFPEFEGNQYDRAWARERYQREAITHGLKDCRPYDIVILGDADEIANPRVITSYQVSQGLCRLKQRMFYYYLNCENKEGWDWQKIAPYSTVKQLGPCGIRYPPAGDLPLLEDAGWHWSMLGGPEAVRHKLQTYSHQEFQEQPAIMDNVERAIETGSDLFGRDLRYEFVDIDDTYPAYVRDYYHELVAKGLVRVEAEPPPTPATVLDFTPPNSLARKKHWTVTAEVCTKDRYQTTLPLTLSAIINQTRKPDKLVIYDDSEQRLEPEQLCETSPFNGLFKLATDKGIAWVVNTTPRKGQVANHQHALDTATTDFVLRIDDDEIAEPNCLEVLLNTVRDYGRGGEFERIGAVGGLVHHPASVSPLPATLTGKLADIDRGNIAWHSWNSGPREVEHLYSTFLYNVKAAREAGGYPTELSQIGHREESIFTARINRAGYKLLVTPHTITHHLRENSGGIRSFSDTSMWEHDEQVFQTYLRAWNIPITDTKLVVCDFGLGDHLILKGVWPELKRKFPDRKWTLALCFPEVFAGEDATIISIADAKLLLGSRYDEHSVYRYAWDGNFTRPMPDVMMEFFSK